MRIKEIHSGFIIETNEDCILNHSLQEHLEDHAPTLDEVKILVKKDHRHTVIPKGIYAVGIQGRFDPIASYKVTVRD